MGLGIVFFEPPCPWLVLPLKFRTFLAPKCPLLLTMSLVFAAGLHETAPRLLKLRGASAPEFKSDSFGGPYIFWIRYNPCQSLSVSRDSSCEMQGYAALPSPPLFPFQLFELNSSCCKEENSLCLLPHLAASSPDAAILLCWAAPALNETGAQRELH